MNPCACQCGGVTRSKFVRGHNSFGRWNPGKWGRNGVPIERVRPLVVWLVGHYSIRQAAVRLDVHPGVLTKLLYGPRKYVGPELAARIARIVVAHREASDPWRWTEEPPKRLPTPAEQEYMRRRAQAELRAAARRGVPDAAVRLGYASGMVAAR